MAATNLDTRTYSAPTCILELISKASPLPHLARVHQAKLTNFNLYIDPADPDRTDSSAEELAARVDAGDQNLVQIQGEPQQLASLHLAISQYVENLIAQFPLSDLDRLGTPEDPSTTVEVSVGDHQVVPFPATSLPPGVPDLPGLRQTRQQVTETTDLGENATAPTQLSLRNISNLLSRWHDRSEDSPTESSTSVSPASSSAVESLADRDETFAPPTPYVTSNPDSLSHSLHLGDLVNNPDSQILTVSSLQLFDLSSVLDLAIADGEIEIAPATPAVASAAVSPSPESAQDLEPASPLVNRLPNLPQLPSVGGDRDEEQFQPDTAFGGKRIAFLSAAPWAAAAAVAVGAPLVFLGPNSSSLKELATKVKVPAVKLPDLKGGQPSTTASLPPSATTSPSATVPNPGVSTAPWQVQPVQPPAVTPTQPRPTTTNGENIGLGTLPPSLIAQGGVESKDSIASTTPPTVTKPLPGNPAKMSVPTGGFPTGGGNPPANKYTNPIATLPKDLTQPSQNQLPQVSVKAKSPQSPDRVTISQKATSVAPDLAKMPSIKVSNQPIPAKTANKSARLGKAIAPSPIAVNSIPLKPLPIETATSPTTKAPKVKSRATALAVKPKFQPALVPVQPEMVKPSTQQRSTEIDPAPQTGITNSESSFDPTNESMSSGGTNSSSPQIPSPQSEIGKLPDVDSFNSPTLQATKRYLQGKWQADPQYANPLQYVIEVNGKNGKIQNVSPQGEAAQSYLQKTGIIKTGERLISPNASGNNNPRIRVVLQPDGNVDAFDEP
jgi:hypothetical protein